MIINNVEVKKQVIDYDFTFRDGILTSVTIDPSAGDTISLDDDGILIHLSAKPSIADKSVLLPEEDITLFPNHLLYINKRTREVIEPTPEEKAEASRMWKTLTTPPTQTVQ